MDSASYIFCFIFYCSYSLERALERHHGRNQDHNSRQGVERQSGLPTQRTFWEEMNQAHGITIHNSEEATRSGANAGCLSIIDLTLTKGNVDLRWSIANESQSTGSGHEILVWEVIAKNQGGSTSKATTGLDLLEFKRTDGSPEEQKSERKRGKRQRDDGRKRRKGGGRQWQSGREWRRRLGGSETRRVRQTKEGLPTLQTLVSRRDLRAQKGAGQSEASR